MIDCTDESMKVVSIGTSRMAHQTASLVDVLDDTVIGKVLRSAKRHAALNLSLLNE